LPELPDARMETRKPIEVPPKFAGHLVGSMSHKTNF
jgi:hypothetical protein